MSTVVLRMSIGVRIVTAQLKDMLLVEDLSRNLFLIPVVLSKAMRVRMGVKYCATALLLTVGRSGET